MFNLFKVGLEAFYSSFFLLFFATTYSNIRFFKNTPFKDIFILL